MIARVTLLLATVGAALPLAGCSSLTKPDEIRIYAEPAPPPKPAAPAAPAPNAGAAQPHAPGSGG